MMNFYRQETFSLKLFYFFKILLYDEEFLHIDYRGRCPNVETPVSEESGVEASVFEARALSMCQMYIMHTYIHLHKVCMVYYVQNYK